jgi:hypothetical protein
MDYKRGRLYGRTSYLINECLIDFGRYAADA